MWYFTDKATSFTQFNTGNRTKQSNGGTDHNNNHNSWNCARRKSIAVVQITAGCKVNTSTVLSVTTVANMTKNILNQAVMSGGSRVIVLV